MVVSCFKFQHVVIRRRQSSHESVTVRHDLLSLVRFSFDGLVQASWYIRYKHVNEPRYGEHKMLSEKRQK